MLGRTPGNVLAMRPLKDGVISDHELTVKMLQTLFHSINESNLFSQAQSGHQCAQRHY